MAETQGAEAGAVLKGADAVSEAHSAIKAEIRAVESDIAELRGFWTGPSAASFASMMGNWNDKVTIMNNVLDTLEAALRGTEKDQSAVDEEHQSTISGLGSLMG